MPMVAIECPCHGCEERHELCHSDCTRYAAYRERVEAIRHREALAREVSMAAGDGISRLCKATHKGQLNHTASYYYHKNSRRGGG